MTAAGGENGVPGRWNAGAVADVARAATALIDLVPRDGPDIELAREALLGDLELARRDDPGLYLADMHIHRSQGFVRVAFRLAFWELLHAPTYEAALLDAVNRGGDADTNGAIVGALFGARFGEEAIPAHWKERVLQALQTSNIVGLRDVYHPRVLLDFADKTYAK